LYEAQVVGFPPGHFRGPIGLGAQNRFGLVRVRGAGGCQPGQSKSIQNGSVHGFLNIGDFSGKDHFGSRREREDFMQRALRIMSKKL
jgi:hypothetical protein